MLKRLLQALGIGREAPQAQEHTTDPRPGDPDYRPAFDRPAPSASPTAFNPRTPDQCYFCARPSTTTCPGCGRSVCPADIKRACPFCSLGSREPWVQDRTVGEWAARRLRPYLRPVEVPPRSVLDVFAPQVQSDLLGFLDPAAPVTLTARLDALVACQGAGNPAIEHAIVRLIDCGQPLPVVETAAQLLQVDNPDRLDQVLRVLVKRLPGMLHEARDEASLREAYCVAALLGAIGAPEAPDLEGPDPDGRFTQAAALLDGGTALDLFRLQELERAESAEGSGASPGQ